jgi:hypothetical protein
VLELTLSVSRVRRVLWLVAATSWLSGCQKPLAEEECLQLLDRYTEFLVREEDPKASPQQVAHDQAAARTAARTDPQFEFSSCSRKVKRRSFECAMTAPSVDAIERCLVF